MSSLLGRSEQLERGENDASNSLRTVSDSQNESDDIPENRSSNGTPRRRRSPSTPNSSPLASTDSSSLYDDSQYSDVDDSYDDSCPNSNLCKILLFRKSKARTISALTWATISFFLAMFAMPIIISNSDDTKFFGKNKAFILLINCFTTVGFQFFLYVCTKKYVDKQNADNSESEGLPTYNQLQKLKKKGKLEEHYPTRKVSASQVEIVNEVGRFTN